VRCAYMHVCKCVCVRVYGVRVCLRLYVYGVHVYVCMCVCLCVCVCVCVCVCGEQQGISVNRALSTTFGLFVEYPQICVVPRALLRHAGTL